MVVLSPLGCTQHKNMGRTICLFWAYFGERNFVYGLSKASFFAVKITYITGAKISAFHHSVLTGSCMS